MGELAAASKVHVMVAYWWGRGDGLAHRQLDQILTGASGVGEIDITDPQSIDRALRIAVADPGPLAELDQWWRMVETRRTGNGTRNVSAKDLPELAHPDAEMLDFSPAI